MNAEHFDRINPDTGKLDAEGTCWVAEAAELRLPVGQPPQRTFYMRNCPEPGMGRCFHLVGTDESGGDVAGWRYEEDDGPNKGNTSFKNPGNPERCPPLQVVIIND